MESIPGAMGDAYDQTGKPIGSGAGQAAWFSSFIRGREARVSKYSSPNPHPMISICV